MDWTFSYMQNAMQQRTAVTSIRMTQESPFVYRMTMQGTDNLGEWSSEGYYLLTASGIQFWMLKDYK